LGDLRGLAGLGRDLRDGMDQSEENGETIHFTVGGEI